MRWESKQPTEEGFYWLRNSSITKEPMVVQVEKSVSGELVIPELYDETPLSQIQGGEWYGPLSVPT